MLKLLLFHIHQAESTFRNELEPAGITVVSRMFKTTEDPVEAIKDLFVGLISTT